MKRLVTVLICAALMMCLMACKSEPAESDLKPTEAPVATGAVSNEDTSADTAALPEIQDKTDKVEFAGYSFKVNGTEVTNATLEGLHIYKITVNTVNSQGNASEATYCGYKLADVLNACGISGATSVTAIADDGYTSDLDASLIDSEYTLVAIEKNKETGKGGTIWLAPCSETVSGSYCKLVVEIEAK